MHNQAQDCCPPAQSACPPKQSPCPPAQQPACPPQPPLTACGPLEESTQAPNRDCPTPPYKSAPHKSSVHWLHHLVTLAFVFFTFLLCLAVTIIFTFHSYVQPLLKADPALLARRSLAFEGPSSVNVLNYTVDGLWCEVSGAAAVDAGLTLGLSPHKFTDRLVGWAVRRVGSVTVSTSKVHIYSDTGVYLATVQLPDVTLPLGTKPPLQLENKTIKLLIQPTHNNQDLLQFASQSWQDSYLKIRVDLSKVVVTGGRKTHRFSWKKKLHVTKHDVRALVQMAIPPMPGLPRPPPNEPRPIPDLASLVYLQSYRVLPPPPSLHVVGTATLPNPIPSLLQGAIALSMPFIVSLPPVSSQGPLSVARVETAPLALTTPNISLAISGHALPLPSTSTSIAPLSKFASDFLAARNSPILVTTDFLRDVGMQGEITIQAQFPAAAERPELLRDVQITNMRISLRGEQIFASAFVRAHIVPPDTLSALRINATRVWPDLLVYDGPAPNAWPFDDPNAGSPSGVQYDERWSEPEPMPLPSPLPPAAFARIRPDLWIPAHTEVLEEQDGVWVHAQVEDVPLEVLPGRDAELRRFISKVLFNMNGARAGVAGIAGVAARVGGLMVGHKESGELELFGLPLHGETWVGKKHLNDQEWNIPVPSNPLPLPPIPTPSLPLPKPHLPHLPDLPHVPEIHLPTPTPWPSAPEPEIEGEPESDPCPEADPEPECKPEPAAEDPEEYYWPTYPGGMAEGYAEELQAANSGDQWQYGTVY